MKWRWKILLRAKKNLIQFQLSAFSPKTLVRRKNDQLREGQSTSSDSQQTVRRPTTPVSDRPMAVWALTLAQDNQLLTRCSHSQFYLAFPLFVKKLLIPEVYMYCMYMYVSMYVQNLAIGVEHIKSEKMSHTSMCVSHIILPTGCNEINQVQVSLYDLYPLWELQP